MRNVVDMGSFQETNRNYLPVADSTTSYWRTEPHEIDELRSTPELPQECDIAIIGAGLAGVSMAYHLTKLYKAKGHKQPSIVLLEARRVCEGATGRNGGHTKVKVASLLESIRNYGVETATEFQELVLANIYAMKETVQREELECEFEVRRSYDVFIDEGEATEMKGQFFNGLKNGERWTREFDFVGPEIVEQVTSIRDAKCAFSSPAASFWPYKFVSQLLSRLLVRNPDSLNLQTKTPVTHISSCADGRNVLYTARGKLQASKLVFATNAYTAGLVPCYQGAIVPYKGTATHLVPSEPIAPHLSHTYNIAYTLPSAKSKTRVDYLNPRPNSSIVVGGAKWTYASNKAAWWDTVDDSTLVPEPKVREHFDTLMQKHFRGWEDSGAKVKELWTGIMGQTSDGMPHVGAVPEESERWVLAGFNGGGNAVIWLTAKGVAEMVVNGAGFEQTGLPAVFETNLRRLEAGKR